MNKSTTLVKLIASLPSCPSSPKFNEESLVPGSPPIPTIYEPPCSNIFTLWLDWSAPTLKPVSNAALFGSVEYTYTPGATFTLTWNGLVSTLNPKFSISSLTLKFAVLDVMLISTLSWSTAIIFHAPLVSFTLVLPTIFHSPSFLTLVLITDFHSSPIFTLALFVMFPALVDCAIAFVLAAPIYDWLKALSPA